LQAQRRRTLTRISSNTPKSRCSTRVFGDTGCHARRSHVSAASSCPKGRGRNDHDQACF
jgi:hypothetical protein